MKWKIGFEEAKSLILDHVPLGQTEEVDLPRLVGRILAEDVVARVNSPSLHVSLKEGYAVVSADVAAARPDQPARLSLIRAQVAGDSPGRVLAPGTTVRVTTGAPLPPGAEAVLADEFTREEDGTVICLNDAGPGRNVLVCGADVAVGQVIARRGEMLHPALIGLLAAAGLDRARVVSRPRVALIGTGDEVVAPGRPLPQGKLYASNIVETMSWLRAFGLTEVACRIVPDHFSAIQASIQELIGQVDAFVTSGGAWGSERDLIIQVLENMGWQGVFHRVRLGPGKAAGFGLLKDAPFMILPGGPPSHEIAFLLLALPGLMAMAGWRAPVFPVERLPLLETIAGQSDWTQCFHAQIDHANGFRGVRPVKSVSRLSSMARKDGLIILPEGRTHAGVGEEIDVQILRQSHPFSAGPLD